jgi:DNA-binding FrmR family transcriptional regulator
MILNWIKRKPERSPLDELREQVAALKQELADEHHCRTAYDQAASKRLAALEKHMEDVRDCMEALTKLTSLDENEQTSGRFHMLRRSIRADD